MPVMKVLTGSPLTLSTTSQAPSGAPASRPPPRRSKLEVGHRRLLMNRRRFLTNTAAATAGMALGLPARSHARTIPSDTVNVAIIGLRGSNKGHPTWTSRGRGHDHYEHLSGIPNVRITHVVDV